MVGRRPAISSHLRDVALVLNVVPGELIDCRQSIVRVERTERAE